MIRLALILIALATGAAAQERVVAALSQNRVAITTDFTGSEIFVYGAIERNRFPDDRDDSLDIIIAVTGPHGPVTVRKKTRVFGIWANTEEMVIDSAPSFYAVATTGPIEEILSYKDDELLKITIESGVEITHTNTTVSDPNAFRHAVIRLNRAKGVYFENIGAVEIVDRTLFQTRLSLPANIFEGDYAARVFLLRGGAVIDQFQTQIRVRKVGLERWIYNLAHEQALLYGILSILVALLAGYGASEIFRLLRR